MLGSGWSFRKTQKLEQLISEFVGSFAGNIVEVNKHQALLIFRANRMFWLFDLSRDYRVLEG